MRIVVTGGTGFVGKALVRMLAARGDDVTVLSRKPNASEPRVREVGWTPSEAGPWTRELDGADAVVNLAGAGVFDERWTPERLAEVRTSRTNATRVLSQAMAERCRNAVLISASAVGIYGMRKDNHILDESAPHGTDVLASICEEWEAAADDARAANIRVVHPRIGIVLGRGGGALERMIVPYKAFVGGPIGDGLQWVSWIHLDDMVAMIAFAMATPELNGACNATAPNPVTMNDFARALGDAMHRPALFRVPPVALKATLGEGRADVLLTGQRVLPKRLMDAGFRFLHSDVTQALRDILH